VVVITTIPYGTTETWWEALFECAVFALTAIWIIEGLLRGTWEAKKLFVLLPLAILTIYAFAQTIQWPAGLPIPSGRLTAQRTLTIDRYQTYLTARKALALTFFLGLLLVHTSTAKRLRWLVRVVIGLGLASALFGILRESLQSPDSTSGFVLPYLYYGTGYAQFISPNAFSYLMEMSFGLLAGLVVGGGVRRQHLAFYIAVGLIIWAALVLSNSRGGILSFACQAVFLLGFSLSWLSARRHSDEGGTGQKWLTFVRTSVLIRVLFIAVIVATLVMGVFWMGGEKLASKVEQSSVSSLEEADGATRKDTWKSTLRLIKQNPWTGVGFGAYFLGITQYRTGSGRIRVDQAHNEYLDLAANGGFVAAALAGWFLAVVIWRSRSSLRSRDPYRRAASLGAAAGILGVSVHSFVDFGLQVTGIAVVFGALIVITTVDLSGVNRRA
jgi:O-antigen ligase